MLLRDLWHLRGQVIASALVVACGIAAFVASWSTYRSLVYSQTNYYQTYRFADVFAQLKRAPEGVAARIREIPGVAVVETRVVREVILDVPGLEEPATGRLVSIPEHRRRMLNDLFIREGRYVELDETGAVLISEAFAKANRLQIGDRLGAVINGRWKRIHIVGIGLSPEYVYEVGGATIFPDNKRFGVLWMGVLAGVALGWYLGTKLTQLYQDYYHFPALYYRAGPDVIALAVFISLCAASAGVIMLLPWRFEFRRWLHLQSGAAGAAPASRCGPYAAQGNTGDSIIAI
jgi:hypothetical protein